MADNRADDHKTDEVVRQGLRALGLIENGEKLPPLVPNLPPETPSEKPKYILITSAGSTSR